MTTISQGLVVGAKRLVPSTSNEFLKIYSLAGVRKALKGVKTVRQALEVVTPSLGVIKRQYGERFLEAYVKVWLINLNELVNATRPLKEHQIDDTAELIVSEYSNLMIADVNLIFRNAKLGKYGDLYGTLSINKILTWFSDYFNERCEVAGGMSRRKADQHKYQDEKYWGNQRQCTGDINEDFRKFKASYLAKNFNKNKANNGEN